MKKAKNIRVVFAKISCWFLFVALLNNVIDTVVANPVSNNEIESVAEWVAEEWMDLDMAIPDTDGEQDDKQPVQKKAADWSSPEIAFTLPQLPVELSSFQPAEMPFYFNPVFDIYTPPPELIS